MPIEVQNDPLSGAEIKEIILARISAALDNDSTLVNDVAYAGFAMGFSISVNFKRSLAPPTISWGNVVGGDVSEIESEPAETLKGEYDAPIPNEARIAHDLPVPALQPTPNGKKKVKIHLSKDQAAPATTTGGK